MPRYVEIGDSIVNEEVFTPIYPFPAYDDDMGTDDEDGDVYEQELD